jgi:hypothetical protein
MIDHEDHQMVANAGQAFVIPKEACLSLHSPLLLALR